MQGLKRRVDKRAAKERGDPQQDGTEPAKVVSLVTIADSFLQLLSSPVFLNLKNISKAARASKKQTNKQKLLFVISKHIKRSNNGKSQRRQENEKGKS